MVFLLNGAIGPGDYVQVQSKYLKRASSGLLLEFDGGNMGGALASKGQTFGGGSMNSEFVEQVRRP